MQQGNGGAHAPDSGAPGERWTVLRYGPDGRNVTAVVGPFAAVGEARTYAEAGGDQAWAVWPLTEPMPLDHVMGADAAREG